MPNQTEQIVPTKNGGGEAQARQGTQLARFNPFALLDELQDELARFWGRPFGTRAMMRPSRLLAQLPLGAPRLDVFEKDGNLVIKADLPGVKKEDVLVELDDGDLIIQGETRSEHEVSEDQYYRMERSLGRFYRRVPLGFDAKPEDIQASMNEGVLEIRIPKPAQMKSAATRIAVK
jgi:HSP20 family protein